MQRRFRASSYKPVNRASSVTGANSVVCSYGKFQPSRDEFRKHNQILTRQKLRRYNEETKFPVTPSFVLTHSSDTILAALLRKRSCSVCQKSFVPVTGLECSYGKIFIPVTEMSVTKTEPSVTGPSREQFRGGVRPAATRNPLPL